jgi:hypothetical protein
MRIIISFVVLLFFNQAAFGQQLKTYSGNYDLKSDKVKIFGAPPYMLTGSATYSYYDDEDYNRVMKGSFLYNGKFSRNGAIGEVNISGNYLDGKKHGTWIVKQKATSPQFTINIHYSGDYKHGYPNGVWTTTTNATTKGKKGSVTWTINFESNVVHGQFKESTSDSSSSIIGYLDKNGYYTGKANVVDEKYEYQMEFNNGLLVSSITREVQSGKVTDKFKIDSTELNYFNQLIIEKDTNIIEEIPYKIIETRNLKIERLLQDPFKNNIRDASLFDVTPGDLSINDQKEYNWIGFKLVTLEKKETRSERLLKEQAEELRRKEEEERRKKAEEARLKAEEEALQRRAAMLKAEEEARKKKEAEDMLKKEIKDLSEISQKKMNDITNLNLAKNNKILFEAYKLLLQYYQSQYSSEISGQNNLNELLGHTKKIDKLCDKVLYISGLEMKYFKEVNKKLKDEKSIEVIERLLEL